MERLTWEKLLSTERERPSQSSIHGKTEKNACNYVARNEFEADYDRIVGSSSVRRLQDKAQVFPLQEDDVTRTRLTHSIEVSAMARSLGKAVGHALEQREGENFTPEQTEKLAALLQVAGLIHDLGNPPFGHYGETVIQRWFEEYFEKESPAGFASKQSNANPEEAQEDNPDEEQEKTDFLYFDGNVQNLRIVSKLQAQNDTYGANFTYATLATIMKYPWPSHKRAGGKKKFGYFKSEEALALKIREKLGLSEKVRHPATYLLEAADDIIYLCDDIEDGVKKGYIKWKDEYEKIKSNLKDVEYLNDVFEKIDNKIVDPRMDEHERLIAQARNFRNIIQTHLFVHSVEAFLENYEKIMANQDIGGFELLHKEKRLIDELKRVTKDNCFACHEVLALELEGDRVISALLDIFVNGLLKNDPDKWLDTRTYCGKIFALISPNFIYCTLFKHASQDEIDLEVKKMEEDPYNYQIEQLKNLTKYDVLHLVTDFISGMTDSYAVNLYQELCGIRRP